MEPIATYILAQTIIYIIFILKDDIKGGFLLNSIGVIVYIF